MCPVGEIINFAQVQSAFQKEAPTDQVAITVRSVSAQTLLDSPRQEEEMQMAQLRRSLLIERIERDNFDIKLASCFLFLAFALTGLAYSILRFTETNIDNLGVE